MEDAVHGGPADTVLPGDLSDGTAGWNQTPLEVTRHNH
jgi:hypothetical protein